MSLRVAVDPLARALGHYTAYDLTGEHVGDAPGHLADTHAALRAAGYEPSPSLGPIPLEAAKRHPETGDPHRYSLRRVAGVDDASDVNAIADRTDAARHDMEPAAHQLQYHVHLWPRDGHIELHSHFEWRPDPRRLDGETWTDTYDRLRSHYRPGSYGGGSYLRGAHGDAVATLVADGEKKSD